MDLLGPVLNSQQDIPKWNNESHGKLKVNYRSGEVSKHDVELGKVANRIISKIKFLNPIIVPDRIVKIYLKILNATDRKAKYLCRSIRQVSTKMLANNFGFVISSGTEQ